MKNKSKTGGKNLNRGRRKWFHKGEFIGLDIQSVIMTVLTMLTIAVTVVMGLLIYNRFKMSVKETNISSTEGIVDSVVEKMNSDLYNIRQISTITLFNNTTFRVRNLITSLAFFTKQILTKYKAWFCTTMKENLWHQNQFLQRKRT